MNHSKEHLHRSQKGRQKEVFCYLIYCSHFYTFLVAASDQKASCMSPCPPPGKKFLRFSAFPHFYLSFLFPLDPHILPPSSDTLTAMHPGAGGESNERAGGERPHIPRGSLGRRRRRRQFQRRLHLHARYSEGSGAEGERRRVAVVGEGDRLSDLLLNCERCWCGTNFTSFTKNNGFLGSVFTLYQRNK